MARRRPAYQSMSYSVHEEFHGHELETACTVDFTFEPGEKPIYHGDNAYPGCGPTVDILRVVVDATGDDITDAIGEDETASIVEKAIEEMSDGDPGDY